MNTPINPTVAAAEQRLLDRLELIHTHLVQRAEMVRHTIDTAPRGQLARQIRQVIHDIIWTPANLDVASLVDDLMLAVMMKERFDRTGNNKN